MNLVLVLVVVLNLVLLGCSTQKPAAPEAAVASVAPIVSSAPVASSPPPPAPSPPNAVASVASPEPPAAGEPILCKSVDDCWVEGTKPVARPKNLRGKKLTPCKGTEHTPACDNGVCTVHAWKC